MSFTEPSSLPIALTAWVLDHAPGNAGAHTAGDGCSYVPTHECSFALSYSSSLNGTYQQVSIVQGTLVAGNPLAPLSIGVVPFSGLPLFIRVDATPTRNITIRSETLVPTGQLDASGNPIMRENHLTRSAVGYWEGSAFFQYMGQGQWHPAPRNDLESQELGSVNFAPPYTYLSTSPAPFVLSFVFFFLSQVKESTKRALNVLQTQMPPSMNSQVQVWCEQQANLRTIESPAVSNSQLQFAVHNNVNLQSDAKVLQIKEFDSPGLVAVNWPTANYPTGTSFRATPIQALTFFHVSFEQNRRTYEQVQLPPGAPASDRPFRWPYIYYGLWNYLAAGDPFLSPFPLGLPYQIAVAGKQTVLVLPLNNLPQRAYTAPELANLNHGDQYQALLEEIQCLMLRSKGYYFWAPNIGEIACASSSAGYNQMARFKQEADRHSYLQNAVQQYYIFDPLHDNGSAVGVMVANFRSWVQAKSNRQVRLYNNASSAQHAAFLGGSMPTSTPFVVESSPNGPRTVGVIPDAAMRTARGVPPPPAQDDWDWGNYHNAFAATYLTDAMRKSGFR
jgi:hypothetical protein